MAATSSPHSALLVLPSEIWHIIGTFLGKEDRRAVSRAGAAPGPIGGPVHGTETMRAGLAKLRRDDDIFDALVPPLRQSLAPESLCDRRQQQVLQLYQTLRSLPKDALGHRIPPLDGSCAQVSLRQSKPLDIDTMLVFDEDHKVVVIGHEPSSATPLAQKFRRGHTFQLAAAPGHWQGELFCVPQAWRRPMRIAGCAQGGVFATLFGRGQLQFWQSHALGISAVPQVPNDTFTAQAMNFSYEPGAIHCVAFGLFLDDNAGLWHFTLGRSQTDPNRYDRAELSDIYRFSADTPLRNFTVGEDGLSSRIITTDGIIVTVPLSHQRLVGARAYKSAVPMRHPFVDAAVSPGQSKLVVRDKRHNLVVWRSDGTRQNVIDAQTNLKNSPNGATLPRPKMLDYRLSPHGDRVVLLLADGDVQLWSTVKSNTCLGSTKVDGTPVVHVHFSAYSHALILSTASMTRVWLPLGLRSMLVAVPHMGASAQCVRGLLRVVGHAGGVVYDLNLAPSASVFEPQSLRALN